MEAKYTREMMILPSQCDAKGQLGTANCFELFMDIATAHAEALGVGMALMRTRGLFWLTIRTKIRFIRRPGLTERVEVSTWPEPPEGLRCVRHYAVTAGGETLVVGKTEWSLMNVRTGQREKAEGVFPIDLAGAPACDEPFARIEDDFTAEPYAEYVVPAGDIDFAGHMNNAAYARALVNSFSSKTWAAMKVAGMEIVFRAPCHEGDVLRLQKRAGDGSTDIRGSLPDGRTAVLARLYTEN